MNKRILLWIGACSVVVCALLYSPQTRTVYAWTDQDYFANVYACDDTYFSSLNSCPYTLPYPPYGPDEDMCRSYAGNAFLQCLNAITPAPHEVDFCDYANYVNQDCIATYGPGSGNQDPGALMSCRNASGIDQCQ